MKTPKEASEKLPKTISEPSDYTDFLKRLHRFFRRSFNLCNLPFNRCNHSDSFFQNSPKKGIALILCYITIFVLTILGTALMSRSISESYITRRYDYATHAFWLSEAGIQRGLYSLNTGNWQDWTTNGNTKTLTTMSWATAGDFDISVTNPDSSNPQITAMGYYPSRTAADRVTRTITVTSSKRSPFTYATFAKNAVSISNNVVINGDVGTNGTTGVVIYVGNNAHIYGKASTGPGGIVTPGAYITGGVTHENNRTLPAVVVSSTLTSLPDEHSYSVPVNQTEELTGDHRYSSLYIWNNATLNLNGPVNLYITGPVIISNNATLNISDKAVIYVNGSYCYFLNNSKINNTGPPKNFILYGTSNCKIITMYNNVASFSGVVYAPEANIAVYNNVGVSGSITGKYVALNANLSYDETLKQLQPEVGKFMVGSWQDTQNPYPLSPP